VKFKKDSYGLSNPTAFDSVKVENIQALAPTLRSAHAGLKPGATSVATVSDRRSAIGDRRYNRGICRCD
jgi:hypothetical protein